MYNYFMHFKLIIGAGSISSSVFPSKAIIARSPAQIIREDVVWHRNSTWTENYDNINEIH